MDVSSLAQAVHVSLDASASAAVRKQALQLLEEVKASPSCAPSGLFLAQVDNAAEVRLVGIQLLEHAVRHRWNQYSPEEKKDMKSTAVDGLMAQGTLALGQEKPFILRKISELVAEIAKRDWPQLWPDLMPNLMQVCQLGPTQAYMVITTIKTLVEDIVDFNEDLEAGRRADLQKALQACLGEIVPFLHSAAASGLQDLRNGTATDASNQVLEAALEALAALGTWAPIPSLLPNEGLLDTLCALLHSIPHRQAAVEILLQLAERKGSKADRLPILKLFRNLPVIVESVPQIESTDAASIDETAYSFVKRVCQMLSVLGSAQLCPLWGMAFLRGPPENFDIFVRALMGFTTHPSPLVVSFTLPCWLQLIKLNDARAQPDMQSFILQLLDQLSMRVMTDSGDPLQGFVGIDAAFNNLDFATSEEWQAFVVLFRSHVANLTRAIAGAVPREAVHHVAQLLSTLMEMSNSSNPNPPDRSALFAAWDGLALLWEAVMSEAYPLVEANFLRGKGQGHTLEVLKQCFEAALKFDSQEPQLLMSELTVLGSLLPCLRLVPEGMSYVLHKLFAALEFNAEQDREAQDRGPLQGEKRKTGLTESGQVRRKAGTLLVHLCAKPPPCFLDSLDAVLQRALTLLSQPNLAEMTHNQLVAALSSALNSLPDANLQARYLDEMAAPFLRDWLSSDMTTLLGQPQQFIDAAALMAPQTDAILVRRRILLTLSSLETVLRQTEPRGPDGRLLSATPSAADVAVSAVAINGSPAGSSQDLTSLDGGAAAAGAGTLRRQHSPARGRSLGPTAGSRAASSSPAISGLMGPLPPDAFPSSATARASLPNALTFIRTLQELWTPASPLQTSEFSVLLDFRRSELYSMLAHQIDSSIISREMTAQELWIDRMQLWLSSLREHAYGIVDQSARQGVLFESAALLQSAQECCLYGMAHMQKRHLKLLVRHFLDPVYRNAPRLPEVLSIVAPLLATAYQGLVDALLQLWSTQQQQRQQAKSAAGSDEAGNGDAASREGRLGRSAAGPGSGYGEALSQGAARLSAERDGAGATATGRRTSSARGSTGQLDLAAGRRDSDLLEPVLTAEQREIVEDKALQDVTEALIRHLDQLFGSASAALALGSSSAAPTDGQLEPLASQLLHSDDSALAILRMLCTAITLPSSLVAGKAANTLTRLVTALGSESPAYRSLVAEHVLPTALQGLTVHGEHSDNQSLLLMLVLRCIEAARTEPAVSNTLLAVPGATPEAVQAALDAAAFERDAAGKPSTGSTAGAASSGGATAAQRRQRQHLKTLLQPIMGVNVGQTWKEDVRVRNLPERLFLAQDVGESSDDDSVAATIFAAVFDS